MYVSLWVTSKFWHLEIISRLHHWIYDKKKKKENKQHHLFLKKRKGIDKNFIKKHEVGFKYTNITCVSCTKNQDKKSNKERYHHTILVKLPSTTFMTFTFLNRSGLCRPTDFPCSLLFNHEWLFNVLVLFHSYVVIFFPYLNIKKKKNLKKALYNAWNKVEKEAFFGQSNQIKNHQHRFCHLSWSHDYW